MPVSLGDVLVIVAPLYMELLRMKVRRAEEDAETVKEDELEEVEEEVLDELDERLDEVENSVEQDIGRLMAMINELHDEARVVHDRVIDHNPCSEECPICVHDDTPEPHDPDASE